MIYVMQLLSLMNKNQIELFEGLFEDLTFELEDMGWSEDPETLVNDMLDNHLGFSFECDKQLKEVTNCILSGKHASAINVVKLRKGLM